VLAQTIPYLPPAVHVAVVDPGVGTARRGVAVKAGDSILVGPDNGLLSWAVDVKGGAEQAFQLTNGDLWLHPVSPTFHGRDIFMPVAAHLAAGHDISAVGDEIDLAELVTLPRSRIAVWLRLRGEPGGIGFLTNYSREILDSLEKRDVSVNRSEAQFRRVDEMYRDA